MRFLRLNPLCADPFEKHANAGRIEAAKEVHHRKAKRAGGTDDDENLQALCKKCHAKMAYAEMAGKSIRGRG